MKVFVWVSYGDSSVYRADTEEELTKLWSEIKPVLDDWFGDDNGVIMALDSTLKKGKVESFRRNLDILISELMEQSDDLFSYGSNFTEVK